ncbi:MAG: hypothetical protein FWE03_03005 [Firmicutes bacterium]|nr:hypothetical protein [Bacillota bacterium]
MTPKNKLIIKVISISLAVVLVLGGIFSLWWFDSSLHDTPELALSEYRGSLIDFNRLDFLPINIFVNVHFEDSVVMVFWSESDKLVSVGFSRCRFRQRYALRSHGITDLESEFWVNNLSYERTNQIGTNGRTTTVVEDLRILSLNRQAYVNGVRAETIRFEITTPNGVTHQVQFWHKELQGRNAQFTVEYRDRVIVDETTI